MSDHDGKPTDTWVTCPWCGEEYSEEAEPCLTAARRALEAADRDAERYQQMVVDLSSGDVAAQMDAQLKRAERLEAEVERLEEERDAAIKALGGEGRLRGQAEAEVERLERHRDALFKVGDRVCSEAMQMTVSVPRKQAEQADRLEDAVNKFRGACLNRAILAAKEDVLTSNSQLRKRPHKGGDPKHEG